MILEVVRMYADWLKDPTYGINAQLLVIPIDAGDVAPPAILAAAITDATRDGNASRRRLPTLLPGIVVMPGGVTGMSPKVVKQDAEADMDVTIRFGLTKVQGEQGFRDVSYYQRAAASSLRQFHLPTAYSNNRRVRNGISIESCEDFGQVEPWIDIEESIVTGAMYLNVHLRDQNP